MSEHIGHETTGPIGNFLAFSINRTREELYERINERVDEMLAMGALEEVKALWERFGTDDLTIHQALGVRQLLPWVRGESELEDCTELMKRDTRRFSKRQLAFLRKEKRITGLNFSDFPSVTAIAEFIVKSVQNVS